MQEFETFAELEKRVLERLPENCWFTIKLTSGKFILFLEHFDEEGQVNCDETFGSHPFYSVVQVNEFLIELLEKCEDVIKFSDFGRILKGEPK